ncbi:MAG TPA: hypothetical protein VF883_19205 [Thermoanaerobaculia bacterium]|jgi:hypothetical protein
MVTARFVLLTLALPFLGAYVRMFGAVRLLPWPGQLALSFATGLLTIVAEMFVLSWMGVHWNAWLLVPLPLLLSAFGAYRSAASPNAAASRNAADRSARERGADFEPAGPLASSRPTPPLLIAFLALAILISAVLAGMCTSGDFVYFWGVKGQRWGAVHLLDTAFTQEPGHYMHPDYPPLLPLYYAWTLLGGDGALDWWGAILATPLFLAAGATSIWAFGRYARIHAIDGIVALFVALYAIFYVRNQVAGNAEPPLHMFEAIALAALTCWHKRSNEHDAIAAIALSGVALTKVEGGIFVLLVCGLTWLAREGTLRQRLTAGIKMALLPVTTLATWLLFGATRGLTDTYVPRDDLSIHYIWPTFLELVRELSLHLWYTPWLALIVILLCGRAKNALPYLLATLLFLLFLLSVYTRAEPHLEWSAGRTLMTPLLLFIAGVLAAHRPLEPSRE